MISEKTNPISPAAAALERAEIQHILFVANPSRLDLTQTKTARPLADLFIRVHRNHSFEHIAQVSLPFFAWWGKSPDFLYSDYDDSLVFATQGEAEADVELVWIDSAPYLKRLAAPEFVSWFAGRLEALRQMSTAPILVIVTSEGTTLDDLLRNACASTPGLRVAATDEVVRTVGPKYFDLRAERFSGTRLSDGACIQFAREIACRWMPSLLEPRKKALAIDLDHTLYRGVLGEDGLTVDLTPGHRELQNTLVSLRAHGMLLALISRNEVADVRELFMKRPDFPLRWEHFSSHQVSWASKTAAIRKAASDFRIGLDAMIFLDDNPGELASVASSIPQIHTLHAHEDALLTDRSLRYYPGVWAWDESSADGIRARDVESIAQRVALETQFVDPADYLKSLRVTLRVETCPRAQVKRLAELSQKTNQFNLNLSRLTEVQLSALLDSDHAHVVAVSLEDRLSDSGMIALLVAEQEDENLKVVDLAVSCRALGRQLETLIVGSAVSAIQQRTKLRSIEFLHRTGPRNAPAREWLAAFAGVNLPEEGAQPAPQILDNSRLAGCPVNIEMIDHDKR